MSRILPDSYKSEVYCFQNRNDNWTDYYLVPDLPRVAPPLPNRPTWRGVGETPNQAPDSLIETQPRDRIGFESNGFLPHAGEFSHYASAVSQESSLRNLDSRLTKKAFGQRIIGELSAPSHAGLDLLPSKKTKMYSGFEDERKFTPECSLERKYDQSHGMNELSFNNMTRATTRNMRLPYMKQTKRPALSSKHPGYSN